MDLDYVYRSRASQLAAVADIAWLSETVLAVVFADGLIEVIDVDDRSLVSSFRMDSKTVVGMASTGRESLVIQTKGDGLHHLRIEEGKCLWTVSTKSAVSFAHPVVVGNMVFCVGSGQSTLVVINLDTAYTEKCIDLTAHGCRGMVAAITAYGDTVAVLSESGHVARVSRLGDVVSVDHVISTRSSESVVATSLSLTADGTCIVGFSEGEVIMSGSEIFKSRAGIGATDLLDQYLVVGTWRGKLWAVDRHSKVATDLITPHHSSVTRVASNRVSRVAAASSDGRVSIWYLDSY